MKRTAVVASVTLLAAFGAALPAWGHASLEQGTAPRNADFGLTLHVPVEAPDHGGSSPDLAARHNQRVTVEIPKGFAALGCDPKPGWTCSVNQASGITPLHIAWTRQGEPMEQVDSFTFKVHTASAAGSYPFETHQTYSDGDVVHWDGPSRPGNPAPVLDVS